MAIFLRRHMTQVRSHIASLPVNAMTANTLGLRSFEKDFLSVGWVPAKHGGSVSCQGLLLLTGYVGSQLLFNEVSIAFFCRFQNIEPKLLRHAAVQETIQPLTDEFICRGAWERGQGC